jgi:ABC-type multidrug transport system ATPase subunit
VGVAFVAREVSARGLRGCAFVNVSVDVAAGQLAVVVGPGGSGRTSLLLALCGRMRLVTGTIRVGDHRLPGDPRAVQRLVAIAQAHPAVDLDDNLRVGELIAERTAIGGGRPRRSVVRKSLDLLGFDAAPRTRVAELPPADRTLFAAGLAAAEHPAAVVVDDADADCGPDERRRVWAALSTLAAGGPTVLASSTQVPDTLHGAAVAVATLPHPLEHDATPAVLEEESN